MTYLNHTESGTTRIKNILLSILSRFLLPLATLKGTNYHSINKEPKDTDENNTFNRVQVNVVIAFTVVIL